MYRRPVVDELQSALSRTPTLVQVLLGPRQVGKTTAALAVAESWDGPVRYAAADEMLPPSPDWLRTQWQLARRQVRPGQAGLLVLDEVQKIPGWSDVVKSLWDADRRSRVPLRVLVLGSSALLLSQGTSDSLAGRFRLHRCMHWSLSECREAFGWDLDHWLFFGGYPKVAELDDDVDLWRGYVRDALVEPALARDVLSLTRVTKPALLRHLFALACHFPARPLSYNKMLGQLQDAGNTTTLAHYLRLLESAYLVSGLDRYSAGRARSRGSTPKLVVWNNALVNALDLRSFEEARGDAAWWGRVVENAAGAHLQNHLGGTNLEASWWRQGNDEVDYVVASGSRLWAIEIKSGRPSRGRGLDSFVRQHPGARAITVGSGGELSLDDWFGESPVTLLKALS